MDQSLRGIAPSNLRHSFTHFPNSVRLSISATRTALSSKKFNESVDDERKEFYRITVSRALHEDGRLRI